MSSRSDLVDLTMAIHAETDLAILASDDGDKANAKWLPKSQIEIEKLHAVRGNNEAVITMPAWLAQDKELI